MDALGQRLIRDFDASALKRETAAKLERQARELRAEADEIDRLAELARLELPTPPAQKLNLIDALRRAADMGPTPRRRTR